MNAGHVQMNTEDSMLREITQSQTLCNSHKTLQNEELWRPLEMTEQYRYSQCHHRVDKIPNTVNLHYMCFRLEKESSEGLSTILDIQTFYNNKIMRNYSKNGENE